MNDFQLHCSKDICSGLRNFSLEQTHFSPSFCPQTPATCSLSGVVTKVFREKQKMVLDFFLKKDFLTSCSVLVLWAVPRLIFQQVELILTLKLFIPKQSCWQVEIQMAGMCCDPHVHISAFREGMPLREAVRPQPLYAGRWGVLAGRASLCDRQSTLKGLAWGPRRRQWWLAVCGLSGGRDSP